MDPTITVLVQNMISTFESENLDEVVFEKIEKPEKPTTQKGLDELERY